MTALALRIRRKIRFELIPDCPVPGPCWIWTAGRTTGGYGQVTVDGKRWYTHRLSYTLAVGPIPSDLQIDHLCRTRSCCNPSHLEAVPPRINSLRGIKATKTHCIRNHPLNGANLIWTSHGPGRPKTRKCRTCENAWQRAAHKRRGRDTPEQLARKAAQMRIYCARIGQVAEAAS